MPFTMSQNKTIVGAVQLLLELQLKRGGLLKDDEEKVKDVLLAIDQEQTKEMCGNCGSREAVAKCNVCRNKFCSMCHRDLPKCDYCFQRCCCGESDSPDIGGTFEGYRCDTCA